MAINKVIYQGTKLIDITDSTVTSDNLEAGLVAYAANGQRVVGTKTTVEGEVNLSFKEFTDNGNYYAEDFGVDGFSGININVENQGILPEGTIQITENGKYNVSDKEFAEVTVSADSPDLIDLNVTPTKEEQVFEPSGSDGYGKVTVSPIPNNYIQPSDTLNITENGIHDVRTYYSVRVAVPLPEEYDGTVTIE